MIHPVLAREAREIANEANRLGPVFESIRKAAHAGEMSVNCHVKGNDETVLEEMGYRCKKVVDDDSDYRGTIISW